MQTNKMERFIEIAILLDFPEVQGLDSALSLVGARVQSLVRELRSHKLHGIQKKKK